MPENTDQNQGVNTALPPPSSSPPVAGAPASGGSPERPSWLPAGFNSPEEFASKYSDNAKRLSELEAAHKKWERWGDADQFENNLAQRIVQRDAQLKAQWEQEYRSRAAQQQAPRAQEPWLSENWAMMDESQRSPLMASYIARDVASQMQRVVDQYYQTMQQRLAEWQTEIENRNRLISQNLAKALENPGVDVRKVYKIAGDLANVDQSALVDRAWDEAMAPERTKKQIDEAIAAERQRWEQEQRNRDHAALTGPGGSLTASFKDTIAARNGNGKSLSQRVMEKGLAEGWLNPGNIR